MDGVARPRVGSMVEGWQGAVLYLAGLETDGPELKTQPEFQSGTPQALFMTDLIDTGIRTGPMSWDVGPDGRFLFITESSIDASVTVVMNWRARMKPDSP